MKLVLEHEKGNFYKINVSDNLKMNTIAHFLTDDVGSRIENWKGWLDSDRDFTTSNASHLYKENGTVSIQTWWLSDNEGEEYKVILTENQFRYLLDQWDKLRKMGAQEIIISLEDNRLTVEGKNPNPEPLDC